MRIYIPIPVLLWIRSQQPTSHNNSGRIMDGNPRRHNKITYLDRNLRRSLIFVFSGSFFLVFPNYYLSKHPAPVNLKRGGGLLVPLALALAWFSFHQGLLRGLASPKIYFQYFAPPAHKELSNSQSGSPGGNWEGFMRFWWSKKGRCVVIL